MRKEQIGNSTCFLFLVCLFDVLFSFGQIENITISEETTIDRLYIGLLSEVGYQSVGSKSVRNVNLQVGTRINSWIIPSRLKIRSFGAVKFTSQDQNIWFSNYELIFTPINDLTISFGILATPTTELRPNPTTWQSQIETNAEKTIIGGRPGGKVKFKISKKLQLTYGLFNHKPEGVHHLMLSYVNFKIATYLENRKIFIATRIDIDNHEIVLTKGQELKTLSTIIPIKNNYRFLTDISINQHIQFVYGKVGIRKYIDGSIFKGFLNLNYDFISKQIAGGLFLHI